MRGGVVHATGTVREIRLRALPNTKLKGDATCSHADAGRGRTSRSTLLKVRAVVASTVGPILRGAARPCTSSLRAPPCGRINQLPRSRRGRPGQRAHHPMTSERFHHLFIRPADFDHRSPSSRDTLGWSVTKSGRRERGARCVPFRRGVKLVLADGRSPPAADGASRPHVPWNPRHREALQGIPKGAARGGSAAPTNGPESGSWCAIRRP